jgi:hypothetical protein
MKRKIGFCFELILILGILTLAQFHPILIVTFAVAGVAVALPIAFLLQRGGWSSIVAKYALFVGVAVMWATFLVGNVKYLFIDRAFIALRAKPYKLCEIDGVKINSNTHLSVCSVDKEWWRFGLTRAVIYDSSGEIESAAELRSESWRRAALSLDRVVPFGIVGFKVNRITGYYYLATFHDDVEQNVVGK